MNKAAGRAIFALQRDPSLKKATVYLEPNYVVKATRKEKKRGNSRTDIFVVTAGRPNFLERQFIKDLKAVGEPFPATVVRRLTVPGRMQTQLPNETGRFEAAILHPIIDTREPVVVSLHPLDGQAPDVSVPRLCTGGDGGGAATPTPALAERHDHAASPPRRLAARFWANSSWASQSSMAKRTAELTEILRASFARTSSS